MDVVDNSAIGLCSMDEMAKIVRRIVCYVDWWESMYRADQIQQLLKNGLEGLEVRLQNNMTTETELAQEYELPSFSRVYHLLYLVDEYYQGSCDFCSPEQNQKC